jgi:hypothetical protein
VFDALVQRAYVGHSFWVIYTLSIENGMLAKKARFFKLEQGAKAMCATEDTDSGVDLHSDRSAPGSNLALSATALRGWHRDASQ